jgi:lambda repressor-like predicted transcriptional regulator
MRNERLRALLLERGKTLDQLAAHAQVDAKTVERWITRGRTPYRRHRFEVASFLGVDESYIWPDALGRDEVSVVSESEIVAVWPHRSEVPRDLWGHLFSQAEREIGVLVYSGLFVSEDAGIQKIFKQKAAAGVRVRILLGDPESQAVADRGEDEGVGDAQAAKIRNALALYRPLRKVDGVEFRFHRTVLYNSIYRADDQVLVNTHLFGVTATHAPVWHLRKLPAGELASLYIDSFERVWETATPVDGA